MASSSDRQTRFPRPPTTATDQEGRTITVEAYTGDHDPLVEMYEGFDKESRSQGVPPRETSRIRDWIDGLLEDGFNVVARHGDDVIGHAVLVPYDDIAELAIFVHPEYQAAGNGTQLIRGLLGLGQEQGIPHVWLTVSRSNRIAVNLYRSAGFETTVDDRGEREMELDL